MGRTLDRFMIVKDAENLIEVNGHRFYTKVGDVGFFRVVNRNTSVWLVADLTTGKIEKLSDGTYNGIKDKFFNEDYQKEYVERHNNGSLTEDKELYQVLYDKYLKEQFAEYGVIL